MEVTLERTYAALDSGLLQFRGGARAPGCFSETVRGRVTTGVKGFQKSVAILVAIDNYTNGVPELRTPVADAVALRDMLQDEHGFDVGVLTNQQASLEGLRTLLADLPTRIGPDDRVLFYFAGHGTLQPSDDGPRGYILAQDASRDSTEHYLPMDDLNRQLSLLQCRHMLIILDCCFAGALRWSSTRDLLLAPGNLHQERYDWFIRDAAWQAIASAAHDEKALDVAAGQALGVREAGMEHSPFAEALIDGLSGQADLRPVDQLGDGVITATELFIFLRHRLAPATGAIHPRQTPLLWPLPRHDKGEFVFLVPGHNPNLPPAPPLDFEANPWLGLDTYESSQSDLFFGRSRVSESLAQRVVREPLVVVTGPSGIGKSSLVRAGLLPRLRNLPITPIVVRPGPAPFECLAEALQRVELSAVEPPDEAELRTDPLALADWIAANRPQQEQFLLVIDQAEELITQNRDAEVQKQFLTLIRNALDLEALETFQSFSKADARTAIEAMGYSSVTGLIQEESKNWQATGLKDEKLAHILIDLRKIPLRVVLTVRSEFEPQFAHSPLSERWTAARLLIPRMTQDELRRVIEGPATVKVIRFESPRLVDQLVNEVVEMPGALPVLSFALSEMYKSYIRRDGNDRTIGFADYDVLKGGVTGSLRARANEVVDAADDQHRDTARRILERFVSVETGAFARRRVPKREFEASDPAEAARIAKIIERLEAERLVVSDQLGSEPHSELAHDALILGWDRFLGWVREDLDRIVSLRRLTFDASNWNTTHAPGLLWDDAERIALVRDLQQSTFPGLNRVEELFAYSSMSRSRRNRIIQWSTIIALCFLTFGAVWFAYSTERERQVSESGRLAASAQLASALDQTLLLSVSAALIHPEYEARSALFAALSRRPQLQRFLHGAGGSISDTSFLSNGNVIGLSRGAILMWDVGLARSKPKPLDKLDANIDDFAFLSQHQVIAARREQTISFYRVDPMLEKIELIRSMKIDGLKYMSGGPVASTVYAVTESAQLVALTPETSSPLWTVSLPTRQLDGISVRGSSSSIFIQTVAGVWHKEQKKHGRWRQLRGPPPAGFVYLPLWSDEKGQRVVSALAIAQGQNGSKELPAGEKAFRCWRLAAGTSSSDCPDLPPIADPAELGFADANTVLYSSRDIQTGYQRADYRRKAQSKWTRETLRLDPRFVTGLAISPNGADMLVSTVDGELGLYSTARFLSGEAYDFRNGTPLLLRWDAQGCRLILLRSDRLDAMSCTLESTFKSIPTDSHWSVSPTVSDDRQCIYALRQPTRIALWDDNLNDIAEIPSPQGRQLSALLSLTFNRDKREVSIVMDEGQEIWTYLVDQKKWHLVATLPFAVRSLSTLTNGNLVAASKDGGDIVALDSETGEVKFTTSLPGADTVRLLPAQTSEYLYIAAVARQHLLYRLDAQSGTLKSSNFNRFSGPAYLLAASSDGKHLVLEGVGMPDGRASKGLSGGRGLGLELWDAERLMPLGEGIRTEDYTQDVAAFAPDQSKLAIALSSPPRIAIVPLSMPDWIASACKMAGRELDDSERLRYSIPANLSCVDAALPAYRMPPDAIYWRVLEFIPNLMMIDR
jgi:outer membrane protein assembly factor BamB